MNIYILFASANQITTICGHVLGHTICRVAILSPYLVIQIYLSDFASLLAIQGFTGSAMLDTSSTGGF